MPRTENAISSRVMATMALFSEGLTPAYENATCVYFRESNNYVCRGVGIPDTAFHGSGWCHQE